MRTQGVCFFARVRTFPFFDLQLPTLKALVQRLSHGFVIWVMVLSEIRVSQSFGGCYSLVRVQNQHFLKKVHSLKRRIHFICEPATPVRHWTLSRWYFIMNNTLKKTLADTFYQQWASKCTLENDLILLPCGLAPRNTSAKFLLGMYGRELI